ncbi:MAG TPA: hypothetical protein VJZ17_05525 [Nitrosopumilaceae archaeon]|nr:hypothetical protein [Nitrosopumilaceae archaeon]
MNTTQLLAIIIIAVMFLPPAFGAISEKTGLKKDFTIETSGYDFEVETVSNFNIQDVQFNRDDKKLTFNINSELENNFAEIQIPVNLINGNLTVFVNGQEIFPEIRKNDKISFIVLELEGNGTNTLEIIGTTYLPEFSSVTLIVMAAAFATLALSRKFNKF